MNGSSCKVVVFSFRFVCILAAICLITKGLITYLKNDDLSQVDYRQFHASEKDIYPSLTICLHGLLIFVPSKLKTIGTGINEETYSDFLMGKHWDGRMAQIDYDNVTVNIEDHIMFAALQYPGEVMRIRNCSKDIDNQACNYEYLSLPSYVSYRDFSMKCFTFDIPFKKNMITNAMELVLNSNLFSTFGRGRTAAGFFVNDNIGIFFHYPKQLFRALSNHQYKRFPNISMFHRIDIEDMTAIERRADRNTGCNNDWNLDDDQLMKKIADEIGCEPLQWKTKSKLKKCSTEKKWKKFNFLGHSPLVALEIRRNLLQDDVLPCREILKVTFNQVEQVLPSFLKVKSGVRTGTNFYRMRTVFETSSYMNIREVQVRSYQEIIIHIITKRKVLVL